MRNPNIPIHQHLKRQWAAQPTPTTPYFRFVCVCCNDWYVCGAVDLEHAQAMARERGWSFEDCTRCPRCPKKVQNEPK
jgi:hypothetical protein